MARARFVPPEPIEREVELIVSLLEAETLMFLLDSCVTGPDCGPRGRLSKIRAALDDAGINPHSNVKRDTTVYLESKK